MSPFAPRSAVVVVVGLCLWSGRPSDGSALQARTLSGPQRAEILQAHNEARARFSVPALEWDDALARQALRCVEQNRDRSFRHCQSAFGENMFASTRVPGPAEAVRSWMDEEPYYEYGRRRCRDFRCGHFSQVVWSESRRLGCAVGPGEDRWTNLVCNYDPPGNFGYMGNEAGDEDPSGDWFYFDPPPFTAVPRAPDGQPDFAGPGRPGPAAEPFVEGSPSGVSWDAPWTPDSGGWRSGTVGAEGRSVLSGTITGPGSLTFRWRVSSEAGYDVLTFRLDGREVVPAVSGERDWESVRVSVPTGVHDIEWIYQKDAEGAEGRDAAWVDRVRFVPGG